ncbi:ABC transporter ATP-binding protein [Carboxydocella sp. ULO1]|uniref:ABC transporter ATP-binding protein n=1 Tax=Carboxydocella sp. ULO1 TaxID=1926599 RepID=UPI0009AD5796|nr:ABC transporter ATP-binding protein [Carboxydocella sp. ULO1]GAW28632.1 lipoprotein-releasing system ATP-binding protein [Carboxydocella sp. ULO1]
MEKEIIVARGLVKTLVKGEPTNIIDGVDIKIMSGQFVTITGPSGSGKSSLLYLLSLLDRPTRGEITVDGIKTSGLSEEKLTALRKEVMGFVFQFHFLLQEFTALENVMIPLLIRRVPWKVAKQRAQTLLEMVDLGHRLNHFPKELSGGQQQRVSIARALVTEPKIFWGDEPTGNLDSRNTEAIYELLRKFNRELGQTIVVVTHDKDLAMLSDRTIEIVDGRVARDFCRKL